MLLDLRRFRGTIDRIARHDPPEAFGFTDEAFRLAGPVDFEAEVRKDAEKVRLVGQMRAAAIACDCSRCLEPFQIPVDARFDLLFLPVSSNAGTGEHQVEDDEFGVSFYRDDVVDLRDVVREQLYLALPMKPLCRDGCRGLCPVCGVNWNHSTCRCEASWVDPRMEVLRRLRDGG